MRQFIISCIIFTLALTLRLGAEVTPVWSTEVAVPGERVMLYLISSPSPKNQNQKVYLTLPQVKGANVRQAVPIAVENKAGNGGVNVMQVLPVYVTPDAAGTLNIGQIDVTYGSGTHETVKIPPLQVCPTSDIKWYEKPFNYGVLWYCNNKEGYEHQTVKCAFKVFLPNSERGFPFRWFVQYAPSFNTSGVEAGTFRAALDGLMSSIHGSYINNATAFAKGKEWQTLDYIGSFTPTKSGAHSITGKVALTKVQGYNMTEQCEVLLPTLQLSALPLPPGAPAGFSQAVGQYSVTAKTSADSLAMNEALEVEITVTGTGDLDRIKCPVPESADNWKLSPASRKVVADVNNVTTAVVFTQLMRPTSEVGGVPAFNLVYFDPQKQEYATAASKPIALPWRQTEDAGVGLQTMGAAEPPPAGTIPVAEMTDIYSTYLPTDDSMLLSLPRWMCYLLYLPAIGILVTLAGLAIRRRIAAGAAGRALEKELANLSKAEGLAFLKGIGAFIESRIPASSMTPELQAIIDKRDSVAFRPDAKNETVGATERQTMLKQVRKALSKAAQACIALLAGFMFLNADALAEAADADAAAKTDYEAAQYSACLDKLQPLLTQKVGGSAEAWHNAGNCEYRLKHPGKAALYYARALQAKPWLREAEANLAFIQRKEGAVVPNPDSADMVFTFLSAGQLWLLTVFATSMLALCIALQIAKRNKQRPWLHTCTALTGFLSLLCMVNWLYYSTREVTDISALPPSDLAYVVTQTDARTAAAVDASSVLQLPASTPVHLLARRGSWAYVETFTGIRGWVPGDTVEAIDPTTAPTTPVYVRFD